MMLQVMNEATWQPRACKLGWADVIEHTALQTMQAESAASVPGSIPTPTEWAVGPQIQVKEGGF